MSVYTYDPINFIYQTTVLPKNQLGEMMHSTTVPPLPYKPMVLSEWSADENAWHYVEAPIEPGHFTNPLDDTKTYADLRKMEYPDITTYIDGVVKGDEAQVADYIQACKEVKARWPKDLEAMTMRDYYVTKRILRGKTSP